MTELMKRFQEETGVDLFGGWTYEIVNGLMKPPFNESPWMKFNEWLAEQLTWRPVTQKPEISDKYYVIRKGFALMFRDVCLFMDGEWCMNRVSEEHGGEYWQPIEKDNACPVVLWFPPPIIPPAPEGE